MSVEIFSAFVLGRIILSGTPGPGVLTSVSRAVTGGFRESFLFLNGIVLCNIIFLLVAVLGMTAISKLMGEWFYLIKIVVGIYLILLGIKYFKSNVTLNKKTQFKNRKKLNTFLDGFLLTLGNPDPILFYASFLPTIINKQEIRIIDTLIMIFFIILIAYMVTGTYCYVASLSRKFFVGTKIVERINKVAGIILGLIGCYMILK